MSTGEERWQRVNLALACFALDPAALGGIWLRARVGPVRDRVQDALYLALQGLNVRRIHPGIGDDALFGGVDLSATLAEGRVVRTKGLLGEASILVMPMAERVKPGLAARLAAALDARKGLSLIALDEGAEPDETLPSALADRLAIHLDLAEQGLTDSPELALDIDALAEARALLPSVTVPDTAIAELAEVAARLGIGSLRAPLQALAVARASAALSGADRVESADLMLAVELVLAPRATRIPETQESAPEPEQPDPPPENSAGASGRRARGAIQPFGQRVGGCEEGQSSRPPPALARWSARWRCAGGSGGHLARGGPMAADAAQAGGSA